MADEPTAPGTPPGIEPDVPDVARIYDYFLGGRTHYPADRAAAQRITAANPQAPCWPVPCAAGSYGSWPP
jgi:hypothetical protein